MTNIDELFSGVCLIADDAFRNKEERQDDIWRIFEAIEAKGIPIVTCEDVPDEDYIKHYKDLSFVILDWEINPIGEENLLDGAKIGDKLREMGHERIISFIRTLNEQTYLPIFIFSQEDVNTIKQRLSEAELLADGKPTNIFVKSKRELMNTTEHPNVLFDEIEKWLQVSPSIYVLKEWEHAVKSAKKNLFLAFSNVHHQWPSALRKAFITDGADPNRELCALIFKNIIARTSPINFDAEVVDSGFDAIPKQDVRKILERERYLTTEHLPDKPATGCLFRVDENGETNYYLNIRPDCDIIRDQNPRLYLLKGSVVDENRINRDEDDGIIFVYGEFREKINLVYLACVDDCKIIEFKFREICIKKWRELQPNRIGRVLPPYITRIQQKYAFYLQRQGIPGLPDGIIDTHEETTRTVE